MDTCQNCGKNINVENVFNDKMFAFMDRVKYLNGFLSGSIEQMGGTGAYKLEYSSTKPYCEECKITLDEKSLVESIEQKQPVTCPNCSHKMPVRKADNEIKEFHPRAIGVVNDAFGTDYSQKNIDKSLMFVFKCMSCGAGLELTKETKRTIKCNYCDNENYLPDIIWSKLHPNKETQPLFLLLDLCEDDIKGTVDYFLNVTAVKVFSKHFENFIREYFEKPFINESVLSWFRNIMMAKNNEKLSFNMDISKIQKYFYDNLFLGISNHSVELKEATARYSAKLPSNLQHAFSTDKNDKVRIALTMNKNLSKDVIKKLQNDSNEIVSQQAKKIKGGFFKNLFG